MSYRSEGLIHRAHLSIAEVYDDIDQAIKRWIEDEGQISSEALIELAEIQERTEILAVTLGGLLEEVINELNNQNNNTIH